MKNNVFEFPIYDSGRIVDRELEPPKLLLAIVHFLSNTMGRVMPGVLSPFYIGLFMKPPIRAKHGYEDDLLRRAKRKKQRILKHSIRIYEWPLKSTSPQVLLAHGWQSRGTALRQFVPAMHNLGYGVVAFDAPAHGESSGWQNNLILTAQIMDQLLDLYPRIRGIIGHSFGGVSSSFLMSHMRKEFNLDFFILISTPTRVQRIFAEFFKIVRAPQKLQNRIIQDLKKRYAFDFEDFDVDINLTKAKIGQILVIHDENDRIVLPANAEAILKANPKAIWIKPIGLGHYLPVKHKKVITACEQILRQSIVRT